MKRRLLCFFRSLVISVIFSYNYVFRSHEVGSIARANFPSSSRITPQFRNTLAGRFLMKMRMPSPMVTDDQPQKLHPLPCNLPLEASRPCWKGSVRLVRSFGIWTISFRSSLLPILVVSAGKKEISIALLLEFKWPNKTCLFTDLIYPPSESQNRATRVPYYNRVKTAWIT